jgi:Type I phosphodiesterase / nucleotide pyrophosphatase
MSPALAYIGPGAGIAFAGSFLSLIVGFFLIVGALAAWPFRAAWAILHGKRGYRNAKIQRLIFLGLDGLDSRLTERFMAEGDVPNLSRLKQQGSFHRLRTTCPALSPVAWSTFATGVNPAKHNIFDFLNRGLDAPRGISVETPPVRDLSDRQISWRIRPTEVVRGSLRLTSWGNTIEKKVSAGDRTAFLLRRREHFLFQFLLHPEESPIRPPGVAWVEVDYPKMESWIFGFLAISTASALVFNRYA